MGEPKLYSNLQSSVSVRVNHLRFINGLQQKELALQLGMSASTLHNKIHGRGNWGLEDALALGEIFNVSIDYLIGNEPLESAEPVNQKTPAASATGVSTGLITPSGDSSVAEAGLDPATSRL